MTPTEFQSKYNVTMEIIRMNPERPLTVSRDMYEEWGGFCSVNPADDSFELNISGEKTMFRCSDAELASEVNTFRFIRNADGVCLVVYGLDRPTAYRVLRQSREYNGNNIFGSGLMPPKKEKPSL